VLLARATLVAIARRYEDAAGLEAAWRHARASILRTDVDLYLLLPLSELISAAARVGDAARMRPHFERALQILGRLGEPPLWSAHVRWAGIQQGILLGEPASLKPHAQALVSASPRHAVAAQMAKAGRVWTAVLAGSVEADAVESAARGLDAVGLAWDGARLAGHGASRSDDRKAAARLLACARELHPADGVRRPLPAESDAGTRTDAEGVLSERELEVARLVVQGKTYAEIGEAIFISPRTVEHHIAHIRRRLGATSRSDVIAKLRVLVDETAVPDERTTVDPGHADGPP
jgi:DNA-binding CsgD family transcriptional regulator